jgi:hypothetical protein
MTKIRLIAAAPLLAFAVLGCAQQASNAPTVARPPTAQSDTNTFGESKDETASNAERARAENYGTATPGSDAATTTAPADSSGAPAPK